MSSLLLGGALDLPIALISSTQEVLFAYEVGHITSSAYPVTKQILKRGHAMLVEEGSSRSHIHIPYIPCTYVLPILYDIGLPATWADWTAQQVVVFFPRLT